MASPPRRVGGILALLSITAQTGLLISSMKADLISKLLKVFQKPQPLEMAEVFKGSGFHHIPERYFNGYPTPFPYHREIEAYVIRFLLSFENYLALFPVLEGHGVVVDTQKQVQVVNLTYNDHKVMIFLHSAFYGMIISLASDDLALLDIIQKSNCMPPMPDESFPLIDPEGHGSLQGELAHWWEHFWLPYWHKLTLEEKNQLNIDDDWREFINAHSVSSTTEW